MHDLEAQCGWGTKNCATWKIEKAVHYFVQADRVTMEKGKEPQMLEGCLIWDVAQPLDELRHKFLNTF